jgi:enamine deaminase RidA (YjgF/YER057c/UK114 family)
MTCAVRSLGLDLPTPPHPVGAYSAVILRGGLGFVSGQFPLSEGVMCGVASLHEPPQIEDYRSAARMAALNVLAQIRKALGSWKRFEGLCRVEGIIAAPSGFTSHAAVLDGASETFLELLGPLRGAHARSAMSSVSLPGDAAVELVVTFAVRPTSRFPIPDHDVL